MPSQGAPRPSDRSSKQATSRGEIPISVWVRSRSVVEGRFKPGEKIFTTWLTSMDRVDHAVTDEEYTEHSPEPQAVCGAVILLAPMEAPPGPLCAGCSEFLTACESTQRADAHRHRRPGWFDRLLDSHGTAPVALRGLPPTPADAAVSPAVASAGFHGTHRRPS